MRCDTRIGAYFKVLGTFFQLTTTPRAVLIAVSRMSFRKLYFHDAAEKYRVRNYSGGFDILRKVRFV